jgi:hypothetical protein
MDEVDAGTWPKRQVPVFGFKGEVVLPKTIRIVIGNTSIYLTGPGRSADGIFRFMKRYSYKHPSSIASINSDHTRRVEPLAKVHATV